jgi:hypothetical protein
MAARVLRARRRRPRGVRQRSRVGALRCGDDEDAGICKRSYERSVPYYVTLYRPYHSRERWFRTFNDAYLTTNWQATLKDKNDVSNAVSAFSTSAMHPTAQGYAAIADSYVRAIGADLCKRKELDESAGSIVNLCPP